MSFWTSLSLKLRPISRLTPKMVLVGLVTRWRLATWPTSLSPFLLIATTLGVVRLPSLLAMISGLPDCITAIAELVVPKSIPIIFAIFTPYLSYYLTHLLLMQRLRLFRLNLNHG